jgi:ABC-type cobalt transport system substrate-binding protein
MTNKPFRLPGSAWLTLAALALLVAFSFFSETVVGERDGSDDRAVELADSLGAEPVAALPFEPSESMEKWLFVLQGALGIGLLGFALRHPAVLRGSREETEPRT